MNTRIEVPLKLPEPHFDDDATIATARQVVPLTGARRFERRRKLLMLAPLLLASTVCGALGAATVNYLQESSETSAVATQPATLPGVATHAKEEASPVAGLPQPSAQEKPAPPPTESANSATPPAVQPTPGANAVKSAKTGNEPAKSAPSVVKRDTPTEAAKLVRKRRVQQPEPEAPQRNRRSGASRIEDLFAGPNP